jgi:hypothetical protein
MLKKWKHFFAGLCSSFFIISPAFAEIGASFTYPVIDKDPPHLQGYRASLWYQPHSLIWQHVHVFFDGSYGHWKSASASIYQSLSIYALAPVLRYYFVTGTYASPFIDLSIGASYLTKTRFADRNLGMHFAFQDEVGLGVALGREQRFSISLSSIHYSNGSMASMNAGITIPLLVKVAFRF